MGLLVGGDLTAIDTAHKERARREFEMSMKRVDSDDASSIDDLVDSADNYVSELVHENELYENHMDELIGRIHRLADNLSYFLKKNETFCIPAKSKAAQQIENWCSENAIGDYELGELGEQCLVTFENEQDRIHFKLKFG